MNVQAIDAVIMLLMLGCIWVLLRPEGTVGDVATDDQWEDEE